MEYKETIKFIIKTKAGIQENDKWHPGKHPIANKKHK